MLAMVGIAAVFVMVFGGYLLAGGKMGIILNALPFEFIMIGGAATGAFLISNDGSTVKAVFRDLAQIFRGPQWKNSDYRDLLCLLSELIRLARQNPVELERHVEEPETSTLFGRYPKIQSDKEAVSLIADTFRSAAMNYSDPHQVEDLLEGRLREKFQYRLHTSHALQTMADGLPALGIVAAVLGVIKTMASIDQPPEVLGKLIGGALVGTFLGVFLAYGLVGPFAARIKAIREDDQHFYQIIGDVLIANLQNHPTNICIEVGRQSVPSHVRPTFGNLSESLKETRNRAA